MRIRLMYWSFVPLLLATISVCPALTHDPAQSQFSTTPGVSNLRTEYKVNPLGIDVCAPRLSWELSSDRRAVKQTAYRIRAAGTAGELRSAKNLLWDTGVINSDQSIHIEYSGPELRSGQRVHWQVRIWDNYGGDSGWSEPAFWEMGLLHPADWRVSWITPEAEDESTISQPSPMLRKEFTLHKRVKSARAYATCHGLYELYCNGRRVGDQLFTPGWTSYHKRLQYQTYDITELLTEGDNAVGAILGDGWYRGFLGWGDRRNYYGAEVALLLQIVVTYADETSEIIGTDGSWNTATGPLLESDIYHGEVYDARLERAGWSEAGFDDRGWTPVKEADLTVETLVAPSGPPVRRIQELTPVGIIRTPKGELVADMGQNMVGWIKLKVKGPAGAKVTLRHAEVLDREGNLYTANLRSAKQRVVYILKGEGEEIYEPRFTFQGFRYVAVDGYPGELRPEHLTGIVIHSDMRPRGSFVCSDSLLTQLQHNIVWGQKGNFLDVPTDCPQRDERMGWTGDAQVFAPTACFNMDVAAFYTKWLVDLAADQMDNGAVPHVIPDVLGGGGSAAWADAALVVPWTVYLYYGDGRILEQQYESMKAWVEYVARQAGDSHLWLKGNHYGDWLAYATDRSDYPGATTAKELIASAYFARSTDILQKTADLLGKTEDATHFARLSQNIRTAFQKEFITPNGRMVSDTQTAYALGLAFDLYPDSLKHIGAARLAGDVKKFGHITTGFVGTPLICAVLEKYGYMDLAYRLLNRKQYPSWLYPITKGATTIWERWDGIKPDGSFQDEGMNSFNHYAYGAIGDWLYRTVAGIGIDEAKPGYKHFFIHPHPGGGLTSASASHHSMYGEIHSSWKINNNYFYLSVCIPANSAATVILPGALAEEVIENETPLKNAEGIGRFEQHGETVKIELGSGEYRFRYELQ